MVFGAETKAIEGLKNAGFDLVNLANNHFSNQGKAGMNYTFDLLNQYGIGYFGAGTNETKAHAPAIKTVNGIEIAFLGYSDRDVLPGNSIAISDTPGLAPMDIDQAKIDILNAKKIADLVMVSMHSGTEYTPFSNNKQISFARSAIDAGANLVFGHHPHVVQGYEHYKGKLIIYSLGNFIFDQAWSKETQQGLATKLTFEGENLVTMNLIPLRIKNWCQPTPLESGTEYDEILRRINLGSEKLKP
jgi:poly-gamma-glutamate synthesis protein (capsule biosynthesis protein)